MLAFGRGDAHTVAFVAAGTEALQVAAGVDAPTPFGWHAVAVGDVRPAPTIAIPVGGTLPLATGYLLAPDLRGRLALELTNDAFALRVRLRVGDETSALTVVQDEVELVTRG
jgi:hypothetical protein